MKSAKQLEENIEYLQENYGKQYIKPLIISKNSKSLQNILPYLQEKGVLDTVVSSAAILSLTLDEIKQRIEFIESIGESITIKKGQAFNSVLGLSKKRYAKKVEQNKKSKETESLGKEVDEQYEDIETMENAERVQRNLLKEKEIQKKEVE